jgi:hypothetical protein
MTGPFQLGGPGCGGYTTDPVVAPSSCQRQPVAAGLVTTQAKPRKVWLAFACAQHLDHLTAPRALHERDRVELAHRQEQAVRVREKRPPYDIPQPIALGVDAHELMVRATQWAQTHPFELPGLPADRS